MSSVMRKLSAQISRRSLFTRQLSMMSPPTTAPTAASGINNDRLFHRTTSSSWEHDPNWRPFKDVLDSVSVFGATQYQSTASVRALQALVRHRIPTDIRRTRKNRRVRNI